MLQKIVKKKLQTVVHNIFNTIILIVCIQVHIYLHTNKYMYLISTIHVHTSIYNIIYTYKYIYLQYFYIPKFLPIVIIREIIIFNAKERHNTTEILLLSLGPFLCQLCFFLFSLSRLFRNFLLLLFNLIRNRGCGYTWAWSSIGA